MAIEIKGIACPQCGATDVEMTSDTRGVCKVCGAQFTVQPVDEGIHIHLDGLTKQDDGCLKAEIKPEFTKEQFLRKAWISLAAEDAPMAVFNAEFGEVQEIAQQVLFHKVEVDVACQASVGYDRQEPYIDYETYYEKEPYYVYEKQWNSVRQEYEERPVEKFRKVEKQRQVTKYKTVTDWSAWSGGHSTESLAVVENLRDGAFSSRLFLDSFRSMKEGSAVPVTGEAAAKMQVSESARKRAMEEHSENITRSVASAIPGDHHRDLDWQTRRERREVCLFNATMYLAKLHFNGEDYPRYAFPFGNMTVEGVPIENSGSLDSAVMQMRSELRENTKKRREAAETNTANGTLVMSLLTIGFLLASIFVSLLIRSTFLVIAMFVLAAASFVINEIVIKKRASAEQQAADEAIKAEEAKTRAEIDNYSDAYNARLLNALNNKLQSLGYAPASADELERGHAV